MKIGFLQIVLTQASIFLTARLLTGGGGDIEHMDTSQTLSAVVGRFRYLNLKEPTACQTWSDSSQSQIT